ncbi:MAG: hypothetical protein K6G47_08350 [Clostridia bacterium]|nr:hypothetical protein [Clostridia bacterium]
MKVANFITSLLASVVLLGGDLVPLMLGFFTSLISVAFYNSSELDKDMAAYGMGTFAATLAILVIFVVVLILSIVGFVIGKRSNKKFTIFYSIVIALTAAGYGLAIPAAQFADDITHTDGAYFGWPICGLIFIPVMLILTVINAIINRKKNV